MPELGAFLFVRQIVVRSLWGGKQGLFKRGTVWLPVALFLSIPSSSKALPDLWRFAFGFFLSHHFLVVSLKLTNDLADRTADRATGKSHWIQSLHPFLGPWVAALPITVGIAVLAVFGAPFRTILMYLSALMLGLAYSIRPVRFKERGFIGLTEYGLNMCIAYVAVPATWVGSGWGFPVLFAVASFLYAWVKLHFHQVVDYERDLSSNIRTYAVRVGLDRARRTLRRAADLATVSLLAMTGYLVFVLPLVEKGIVTLSMCAALPAGGYAWLKQRRKEAVPELPRELPFSYLGLLYGFWWVLPPLLLIRLAFAEHSLAIPAGISLLSTIAGSLHFARYRYE